MIDLKAHLLSWYGILLGVYLVYQIGNYISLRISAKKLGCKPYHRVQHDGWLGFKVVSEMWANQKEGTVPDFIIRNFEKKECASNTFAFMAAGKHLISTRDPENIKAILATQFNDFALGTRHAHFKPLLGDGIFTLDGGGWKHSRAMLRPQFAREQVGHVKVLEPHIQTFAKHVRKNKGQPFDIQELFFKLTVDSASEFLFGESVDSLKDESIGMTKVLSFDGKDQFYEAFNRSQIYLWVRALLQNLGTFVTNKEFRDSVKKVHTFANHYVQKALQASPAELEEHSKGGYVFLYELVKETRNPKILRDQLLNILLAGRDTTAGLLSFTFFELSRNPSVWEKLKEEIYGNFGSGEDAKVESITFESLKRCEYLKAVINEILRMYPSVPQNFRVSTKTTSLPRGGGANGLDPVLIPKGQVVSYSVYCMHRNPEYYGKDYNDFRPERWEEPACKKLGWAFLPFNGGPRICLGQQFALTEASYVITRLVQMFPNIQTHETEYPPRKTSHLTMSLQNGCSVSLF